MKNIDIKKINSMRYYWAVIAAISAGPIGTAQGSALSDAAAGLEPGQMIQFSTQGFGGSLLDACDGAHSIFEWANKATWNSIRKEVHFVGQGHFACAKHIVYEEATNQWRTKANPSGVSTVGHGYEHNTINPNNGDFYYRNYNSRQIEKYNAVSDTWSSLPLLDMDNVQVAGAIEYFPEAGGLLFVDGDWGVYFFSDESNSWSFLANTTVTLDASKPKLEMDPHSNFASYNPQHGVVYFGGGGTSSTSFYRLDDQKNIEAMANSPVPIGINSAMSIPDPSSGTQLIFADNGSMYAYDKAANQWLSAGSHSVMNFARDWRIFAPIPEYGVIMFMTWDFDNSSVFLYRYAEGSSKGAVSLPSAPAQLKAD